MPNAPEDTHALPAQLGSFNIEMTADGKPRLIGRGTYGETYLARHRFLESHAAIKVINARFLSHAKTRERFLAEAKAVARLRHPHIAQVHDFGVMENGLFYAMEFCAGGNLAEWMRKHGSMSPRQLLAVAQQVASALKCCHAEGFIHRDLKPANLMLASGEGPLVVKLIDFGLVQDERQEGDEGEHRIGTPLYASPEQLQEQDVDVRSDLFSFGMTLWHLATNQPPDSGTSAAIIRSRLAPTSYAGRLPAALPAPLRTVIEGLVEKDRVRRPAGAAQVLDSLNVAALALGFPSFTDLAHAPESGVARPPETVEAPAAEIETFEGPLEKDFVMANVVGDSASGRTYLARPNARGGGAVLIHVLESKIPANPRLLDRVRQNVGRLAAIKVPSVLAVGAIRSYSDFTTVQFEAPVGGDLLAALKTRGKVPIADARPFLETIASTCDRLTAAGLPGVELGAAQIFVPADSSGPVAQWQPVLTPRLLALRDRAEAGETFMPVDGDTTATMEPDALTGLIADDLPGIFARLLYRITAGRDSPAAAGISIQGYVPVPELSEDSNRILAQVIGKEIGYTECGPLLGRVLALEGLGGTAATRTHTKIGTDAPPLTSADTLETAVDEAPKNERIGPIVPLPPPPGDAAPPPPNTNFLIAKLAAVFIVAGAAVGWWIANHHTVPNPAPAVIPPPPPIDERLAAGAIIRLKADKLLGAPTFTANGTALAAKPTEEGWELTVPADGLPLPIEIVGELAGFDPEKVRIEGRGELRSAFQFFPKMQKGHLVFVAEGGCDYTEVGARFMSRLDGSPATVPPISFTIAASGETRAELQPGIYKLMLSSYERSGERGWRTGLKVQANTRQTLTLPRSWAGAYSGALQVTGSAAPGGASINFKLKVNADLGGIFTEGAHRCKFDKGDLDPQGNLKLVLRWSRPDEGDPSFDWKLIATTDDNGRASVVATESSKDVHLESQLGRAPYNDNQWKATGTMNLDGK